MLFHQPGYFKAPAVMPLADTLQSPIISAHFLSIVAMILIQNTSYAHEFLVSSKAEDFAFGLHTAVSRSLANIFLHFFVSRVLLARFTILTLLYHFTSEKPLIIALTYSPFLYFEIDDDALFPEFLYASTLYTLISWRWLMIYWFPFQAHFW